MLLFKLNVKFDYALIGRTTEILVKYTDWKEPPLSSTAKIANMKNLHHDTVVMQCDESQWTAFIADGVFIASFHATDVHSENVVRLL